MTVTVRLPVLAEAVEMVEAGESGGSGEWGGGVPGGGDVGAAGAVGEDADGPSDAARAFAEGVNGALEPSPGMSGNGAHGAGGNGEVATVDGVNPVDEKVQPA
jgi:hypothetical protein